MPAAPFTIDEYVRWSDVDYAGIIFYGAYLRFFEIAETEMFRRVGLPYGEIFERLDIWLPRVHLDCDFSHPARLDDRLRVAAYVPRFGRSSVTLQFDVVHLGAGRLAASGHEVLVCTDRTTMRPTPLPPALRRALEPYSLSEPDARAQLGLASAVGA
ncbi:MAG TPA: thioesterase family protein [Gemmatimonadales bacterium]|nr:thioesterase family protein [Gemmatimonadales bacterium]